MFNHQPAEYECPFCKTIAGIEDVHATKQDIVYQNEYVTAKVAPKWWVNNPGSILVVPNRHFENIYDIPDEVLAEVYTAVKKLAIAVRSTYGCEGISTRQHNEPAGNQDVWHFHVHVFPRYKDDDLYLNHENKKFVSAEERLPYAVKIREFLAAQN
jgi:histidine triad (HIT) family protein